MLVIICFRTLTGCLWKEANRMWNICSSQHQCWAVLETRCRCKRVQRSKRKWQRSLKKKAWVSKIIVFGFQRVHGNGENTWSIVDASTRKYELRIAMKIVCKVRQFLSFLWLMTKAGKSFFSTRIACCSANLGKLKHGSVYNNKRGSQESRKKLNFYEKLQLMKMGKV